MPRCSAKPHRDQPNSARDLVNLDRLAQLAVGAIVNQDLVVGCHNGKPTVTLGERGCGFSVRQGHDFGQCGPFCRQARDKQANDHYNAHQHCGRQHGYQPPQEPQICWFHWLNRICHVHHFRSFSY